jgi:hypothetical protein
MIWFLLGAALGAAQLAVPIVRGTRESEMPVLFIAFGAALGAAVYGTILWALATYVFGY